MKPFNMYLTGVGGQGMMTLMAVIAQAALKQGYDVKTSELHGLAQRGGVAPCTIRIGQKINTSLIPVGKADLVMSLELLEGLRAAKMGSKGRTVFLISTQKIFPMAAVGDKEKYPSEAEVKKDLKMFGKEVILVDAIKAAEKATGNAVMSNIYLLGCAAAKKLLPIKKEFLLQGIKDVVPEKFYEDNKKVFLLPFTRP